MNEVKLSHYNMELVRVLDEKTDNITYNGQRIEMAFRPITGGTEMKEDELFKDLAVMNSVRTSSNVSVKDAYEQLLTVMAISS